MNGPTGIPRPPPPPQQQQQQQQRQFPLNNAAGAQQSQQQHQSIPLPTTNEEVQRLFLRWQTLKQQNATETTSPEYAELSRILRAITRQQEFLRQRQLKQQQQQQQAQSIANTSNANPNVNGRMVSPSPQLADHHHQRQPPHQQQQPQPQQQPQRPAAYGGRPAIPAHLNPFTPDQMNLLRNQIMAFKLITRNAPVSQNIQNVLFASRQLKSGSTATAPPSAGATPSPDNEVVSYVSPYAMLDTSIPYDNYIARQKRLMIPSLLPEGVSAPDLKLAREQDILSRIGYRMEELEKLPANIASYDANDLSAKSVQDNISDDLKVKALIELKGLRLLSRQKALRKEMVASLANFNNLTMTVSRANFRRMKKQSLREARLTEQLEKQQRVDRERKEKQKQLDYLQGVITHGIEVLNNGKTKKARRQRLGKSVMSFHYHTEKEEQKKVERTAKQRLQALKANDEEAYIKLLDQTKDTRITHLLKQTNSFLDSLAQAVKDQQRETRLGNLQLAQEDHEDEEEEHPEKIDYYAVAHKIKENVPHQPSMLVGGTLKEYQVKGLQWMVSLYNNSLNGILADEMGLGKTIQTISLICYLIEVKRQPGPYLVIVPLSTLTNWTIEFEKWAPTIKKVVYKGPPMARKAQQGIMRGGDFQVCLTTYEYIIKDRPVLSKVKWIHMIIDEGHRLKNAGSKLSYTLSNYYHSRYRLILTGTPLQNNLPELWALLNFVLPKIFNSVKSFDEWFNTPFANTGAQDRMELSEEETLLIIRRLHKVLRPFLLRRLKKDVEKDLPDKIEKVIKCKMSSLQVALYHQMLKYNTLFIGQGAHGATKTGLKGLNNQIMQLRKICNHPFVFEEIENLINPDRGNNDNLWRVAGKFELLDRVLPKFKKTGHRVLLFFQMTQIMDIMEDFLRLRGYQYLRLDGSTKADERSELLRLFNAPNSPYFCFLLSTRAGGLGLNLQSADTVIIYDTDWNPHQDLQAQDRAHRIGQTKEVRILRLITEESVEEMILQRAHDKLEIDGKVIQAGKFDNKSTAEEQEAFLRSLLEEEEMRRLGREEDDELDDEELNEILARTDNERIVFKDVDDERNRTSKYGKGKIDRLFTKAELPEVYQREDIIQDLANAENVAHIRGRGARERKIMHYDDGLTEEQWLDALENEEDTIEGASARKLERAQRRRQKQKQLGIIGTGEESADGESPSRDSTPASVGKRKHARGQSVSDRVSEDVDEPPVKRPRGKPRKFKIPDILDPASRSLVQKQLSKLYTAGLELQDENGRSRSAIFLDLPPKKIYPDYYVLIQNPISFNQISKKLKSHTYNNISDMWKDLVQMFDNARTYNEETSFVYQDADILQAHLTKIYDGLNEVQQEEDEKPDQVSEDHSPKQEDDESEQ